MIERFFSDGRFNKVVKAGPHIYLAGLTTRDKSLGIGEQTADILLQIDEYLLVAGADKTKLVKINIWLSDIADFAKMNEAWNAWSDKEHLPVRATVESKLATGNLVEIMAEAYL